MDVNPPFLSLPLNKKYNIIYADPPWTFEQKAVRGNANDQYPTMTLEEIKSLPVSQISEDNAALFLWVVMALLPEALEVIQAWGFKYKTLAFVWIKGTESTPLTTGVGWYTRPSAELCLLSMKGRLDRANHDVYQVHHSINRRHSQKPNEFRERIVKLFGDIPRIELFARRKAVGWDVWGNEAPLESSESILDSYS